MALSTLFVDMNSYFASVEQQDRPRLRGRPVAVVPLKADTTCCIAASYEAKAHGVKTGTRVADARRLCPQITLIEARPGRYVEVHHRIIAAVESILPVEKVRSIDELSCRLIGEERIPEVARSRAMAIKHAIRAQAGDYLSCSIGIAPNRMLAKVAADMRKPDGLTIIERHELPQRLYDLELIDLPGIGPRMRARLERGGVHTLAELCALPADRLETLWNSIIGRQWWSILRGEDVPELPTQRRTLGHSHVLPPERRTDEGAYAVLVRLLTKAATRLRAIGYAAGALHAYVSYQRGGRGAAPPPAWEARRTFPATQDTRQFLEALASMWRTRPAVGAPLKVGVVFTGLCRQDCATLPLFGEEQHNRRLDNFVDGFNQRYGKHALYFASMHETRTAAPTRIAFTSIPKLEAGDTIEELDE